MFETLEEQMKIDDQKTTNSGEKMIRWTVVGVLSVVLFGILYFGITLLEGY